MGRVLFHYGSSVMMGSVVRISSEVMCYNSLAEHGSSIGQRQASHSSIVPSPRLDRVNPCCCFAVATSDIYIGL